MDINWERERDQKSSSCRFSRYLRFGKKTVSLRSSHNAYLEGAWSTNRPEVVKFYDGNEQGKQPTSNAAKRSVNQLTRRWRKLGAKVIYFRLTKVMSDSTFENLAQGKR